MAFRDHAEEIRAALDGTHPALQERFDVLGRSGPIARDLDEESAEALAEASGGQVVPRGCLCGGTPCIC